MNVLKWIYSNAFQLRHSNENLKVNALQWMHLSYHSIEFTPIDTLQWMQSNICIQINATNWIRTSEWTPVNALKCLHSIEYTQANGQKWIQSTEFPSLDALNKYTSLNVLKWMQCSEYNLCSECSFFATFCTNLCLFSWVAGYLQLIVLPLTIFRLYVRWVKWPPFFS